MATMATNVFSRAFSTRRNKPDLEISAPMYVGRAASQRGGRPVTRTQISSPMSLISTSNSQIHHAHSIIGAAPVEVRHVSNGSTSSSSDESDASNSSRRSHETVTDASSIDESPIRSEPEPNHLSCYFKPSVDTAHSRTTSSSPSTSSRPSLDTPRIPQRVPSHSKRAHEVVHRKRSIQRMLSPPPSRDRDIARTSTEIFNPNRSGFVEAPKESPFGNELAQLDAVAEEFGQVVRNAEADADVVYMESHGFAILSASDYLSEIEGLVHDMLREDQPAHLSYGGFF